jgi:hypothetical protein
MDRGGGQSQFEGQVPDDFRLNWRSHYLIIGMEFKTNTLTKDQARTLKTHQRGGH